MSTSTLEDAKKALDNLNKILPVPITLEKKSKDKIGIIYSLSTTTIPKKVYIGFEFIHNIEYELKDLLVRYMAYIDMGYLFEASAEVLKGAPVIYNELERLKIKDKYELANIAERYILELGSDICVNLWIPESLKRGLPIQLYDDDDRINDVEKYKAEKEEELLEEYETNEKIREYRKLRMCELRELKEELYDMMILNKPVNPNLYN